MFVLVIPPPLYGADDVPGMFGPVDFARLSNSVDFFSLMSYDYSSIQRPGPNAPIQWMKKCVEILDSDRKSRSKILLGNDNDHHIVTTFPFTLCSRV